MFLQLDLNDKNLHQNYVELCEKVFETYFNEVVQNINAYHKNNLKVLTIAGPTSSGKTTIALKLSRELIKIGITAKIISMDNFFKNRDDMEKKANGNPNFEVIEAIDTQMLIKCINEAINHNKTKMPEFNFAAGRREEKFNDFELNENEIMIIEGIHGLNPKIVNNFAKENLKSIYVTIGEKVFLPNDIVFSKRDVRFLRRLIRDYKYRGASPETTFRLWETVRENESVHIFEYEPNADIKINSFHRYELSVMRKQAEGLLINIDNENPYYCRAQELMNKLSHVPYIDESLVPKSSLVREFIGDSIYYEDI